MSDISPEEYFIHASSSFADSRKNILKQGDSFGIFDRLGDIFAIGDGYFGLYHEGTRYLSQMEFYIEDKRPLLLSANLREENETLTVDLSNPDFYNEKAGRFVEHGLIHILRTKFIREAVYYERIEFKNFAASPLNVKASFRLNADFVDIFEVRGMKRKSRGTFLGILPHPRGLSFSYEGLDRVHRTAKIEFDSDPERISGNKVDFRVNLGQKGNFELTCKVHFMANEYKNSEPGFDEARQLLVGDLRNLKRHTCSFLSDNEQFNEWINRSLSDLYTLLTETKHGLYPYAGIPWYSTAFGRDGIITALMCMWMDPEIAKGALTFLAATQAETEDSFRDAEPGKIFHEVRNGEMALNKEIPFERYYGTIDATPLFVVLAGEYLSRTNDLPTIKAIWPNILSAMEWIERYGDIDQDGFVEYRKKSPNGLDNQGWKDSVDSISYQDGLLAEPPIALAEVQGYVYDAKLNAAMIARLIGAGELADQWTREAAELKEKFNQAFWSEEKGIYALALDGSKRKCNVVSSNAGHCLFSGIADPDKARKTAETLLSEESFSGWGIRTLAKDEIRYNPMSYHNGSVWPHDNALIAYGMKKYGFLKKANKIFTGLMDTSLYVDNKRLPELFCGFERREMEGPTAYPVACSPQAWAVASVFLMIRASLGIEIDAGKSYLCFNRPTLPDFLNQLTIENLRINDQLISFKAERSAKSVSIKVLERPDDLEVNIRI